MSGMHIVPKYLSLAITTAILVSICLPGVPVAASPDDQGGTITYGQTVQGSITDQIWRDDWTFSGRRGDVISVDMMATSGDLDTYLGLLGPDGKLLAVDDDGGEPPNSLIPRFPLPSDGTYTIVATRYQLESGTSTGNYSLTLTLLQQGFTTEPGVLEFRLTWNNTEDLDLLVYEPDADMPIYWRHTNTENGGLLVSNGNDYCQDTTTTPSERIYWVFGNAPIGTYRIQVRYSLECAGTQGEPIPFLVTVLVDGQEVDSFGGEVTLDGDPFQTEWEYTGPSVAAQPGPWPTESAPECGPIPALSLPPQVTISAISYGETVTGRIDDPHYAYAYLFCGLAGDEVEITMTVTSGNLQPSIQLADSNGAILQEGYAQLGRSASISYTLPQTGWYVVGVSRIGFYDGTSAGGFSVTLNATGTPVAPPIPTSPVIPIPTLPDGTRPTQLNYGDTYWGTINDQAPIQWFTFGGGQGDQVTISVEAVSGTLIPHLQLGDADLNLIDEAIGSPTMRTATINFTLPETAWYLIGVSRVDGETGKSSGDYLLTLQGTPSQVQPLGVPTSVPSIPTASAAQGMQITLSWNAPVDLDLQVLEPNEILICYNEPNSPTGGRFESNGNDFCRNISPTPSESVTWSTTPPQGSYRITVHYFNGCGYAGQVEFTITITENGQMVDSVQGVVTAQDDRFNYVYTR